MSIMDFSITALKNLFSKPATSQYPAVPKEYPERSRGHVEIDIDNCIMCGICSRKCMSGAIKVDRATKTWSIERMGCVQCQACVNACPKKWLRATPSRLQKKLLIHTASLSRSLLRLRKHQKLLHQQQAKSQTICQNVFFAVFVQESAHRNALLLTERKQKPGQLTWMPAFSAVPALTPA